VAQRREPALPVAPGRDGLHHARLVAHVRVHLRAGEHELDGPADDPRRGRREQLVRPNVALGAEAAAGVRADHAHRLRRQPEHARENDLRAVAVLHRVVDGEPVAVPLGQRRRGLHRVVVPRGLDVGRLHPARRRAQAGLQVALAEVDLVEEVARVLGRLVGVLRLARRALDRRLARHGERAGLVAGADEPGAVPGRLQRLGQHDRDRLALVADLVALHRHERRGQRRRGRLREPGQVSLGQHAHDAGRGQRGGCVDRRDPAGRDGCRDQDGVELALGVVVGRVGGAAGDLGPPVGAGERGANRHADLAAAAVSSARSAALRASVTL
jgi:hypothetical protein